MGVDVGNYGDHEVKAPEPEEPPPEDIIAEDVGSDKDLTAEELATVEEFSAEEFPSDKDLTDEELDAQLKTLSDLAKADRSEDV